MGRAPPEWSARESSPGVGALDIINETHASYAWHATRAARRRRRTTTSLQTSHTPAGGAPRRYRRDRIAPRSARVSVVRRPQSGPAAGRAFPTAGPRRGGDDDAPPL